MIQYISQKSRDDLASRIEDLRNKLKTLPPGNLVCVKCRQYTKWYISNGQKPIYIQKKDRPLAEALALKKYYTLLLNEFTNELKFVDHYLKHHAKTAGHSQKMLDETSRYKELLTPYFLKHGNIPDWLSAPSNLCKNHPENLIHKTFAGHYVRSKSEVIIANALFMNKIPYRYELPFEDYSSTIYPDFTICHPQTQETFYWEHFGMMDNSEYRERAFNKLKLYGNNNILPSINLITSLETKERPIDSEEIQRIIQNYFL